ncbi:hypothetical protein GDO78_021349 [Eleutherodactylus coqui]|uniref:Ig-like domain-containing protein n=1 Tax=Eleutherodactylus coqui TaxID=57060 RepID=A0A8J6C5C7_ELECQ|nr:hypothetical protein GDO78_021349 [Eleutherodactylus coqui]
MFLSTVSPLQLAGPSAHATRLGSDALVPCMFTVDNPPVDLTHLMIFWLFQDKEILKYNETVRRMSSRYSLSTEALSTGIANLTISSIQIPDGGMYKCSVTITNKTVVLNEESILRCSVTGFYPVDISIKWFRDGEKLNQAPGEDSWRNPDRTYNVNSSVTITPSAEDRGKIFSCRVQHEFLQEPLQEDFHLVYRGSHIIIYYY